MKKRKQRSVRNRYTKEVERHIVALIEQWPANKRLKWTGIVAMTKHDLGLGWTRQTLEKKAAIRAAYEGHADRYREYLTTGKIPRTSVPEVIALQQKIDQLQTERKSLLETLRSCDERLVRYLANAIRFGVSQEQLESPMLKIVGEVSVD